VTHCPALTLLLLHSSLLLLRTALSAGAAGAAAMQQQHRPLARPVLVLRWRGRRAKSAGADKQTNIRE